MNTIQYLQLHLALTLTLSALLGLAIGSFLNVVIFRYPKMLKQMWKLECHDFLKLPLEKKPAKLNLIKPASHCPKCKKPIKPWHNIPILSYLLLLGKCAYCKKEISPVYPIVEMLAAAITIIIVSRFGVTWTSAFALILSYSLIALSFIDIKEQMLPDTITIPVLWIGLFANTFGMFAITSGEAIVGAIVGYLLLWAIAKLFKVTRKKEGMGYGDFKMLAMLGAWLGVTMLLNILLTAILIALVTSILLLIFKKIKKKNPIPFGPYLALSGVWTMIYGPTLFNLIEKMVH